MGGQQHDTATFAVARDGAVCIPFDLDLQNQPATIASPSNDQRNVRTHGWKIPNRGVNLIKKEWT